MVNYLVPQGSWYCGLLSEKSAKEPGHGGWWTTKQGFHRVKAADVSSVGQTVRSNRCSCCARWEVCQSLCQSKPRLAGFRCLALTSVFCWLLLRVGIILPYISMISLMKLHLFGGWTLIFKQQTSHHFKKGKEKQKTCKHLKTMIFSGGEPMVFLPQKFEKETPEFTLKSWNRRTCRSKNNPLKIQGLYLISIA